MKTTTSLRFDDSSAQGSRRAPRGRSGRSAGSVDTASLLWKNRAMATVRATATRWLSDDFPGFVEIVFADARGVRHTIHEKVPVRVVWS